MRTPLLPLALILLAFRAIAAEPAAGYYRYPAIHGETVVFTAEGDLWRVNAAGGVAQRLTSHPGQETNASLSPDGKWIAFSAQYEGPVEAYVMPLAGGLASEKDLFVDVFKTNDSQRGVKSFLENGPGKAVFEGN